jgi:hypothetical protein
VSSVGVGGRKGGRVYRSLVFEKSYDVRQVW